MSEEFVNDIIASIPSEGQAPVGNAPDQQAPAEKSTLPNREPLTPDEEPATSVEPKPDEGTAKPAEPPSDASIESLATKLGWSAEHQGDSYVDAATYILRSKDIQSSMKDHNRELKNQLTVMKDSIDALQVHNEKVYKAEVLRLENELAALTQKKRAAIEVGDVDEVENLDKQINSMQKTISEPVTTPKQSSNPVYDDWVKDNNWYVTDPDMAAYADQVAQQYVGAPADRIYKAVRNRVAELWPEKFAEPKPSDETKSTPLADVTQAAPKKAAKPIVPPNPVEGGHSQPTAATFTKADLTPSQQSMMNQFSKLGIMTEAQYIADIAKLQGE